MRSYSNRYSCRSGSNPRSGFRAHVRKQQHITNRGRIGEQHYQAVNANPLTRGRRHTVLQRTNIILVKMHGLKITGILVPDLLTKTFRLVFGIVQLGKTIGNFTATDKELEAVGNKRVIIIASRQW